MTNCEEVTSHIVGASNIGENLMGIAVVAIIFLKHQCYLYDLLYKEEHDILLHPTLCGTRHFVTQSNVFFVANE